MSTLSLREDGPMVKLRQVLSYSLPTWTMTVVYIALVITTFSGCPPKRESVRANSQADLLVSEEAVNTPRLLDRDSPSGRSVAGRSDPNAGPDKNRPERSGRPASQAGIESEFNKVAEEIQMRLEHEHSLYLYQFVLIGGVVTVLIGTSGFLRGQQNGGSLVLVKLYDDGSLFLGLGVLALALLIVDIHIRFNALVVQSLGDWIRIYYEPLRVPSTTGWEIYWRGSENHIFRQWDSFLFMMLYLPTIVILLGFYSVLFYQDQERGTVLKYLQRSVFGGVQISLVLFAVINRRPGPTMSAGDWILTTVWIPALGIVLWQGLRRLI